MAQTELYVEAYEIPYEALTNPALLKVSISIDEFDLGRARTLKPNYLVHLKKLKKLSLYGIRVSQDILINEICKLPHLEELTLMGSQITRMPDEIGDLSRIKSLTLRGNQLHSLPASFAKLGNCLEQLNLMDNRFKTIPLVFVNMKKLKRVTLRGNPLEQKYYDFIDSGGRIILEKIKTGLLTCSTTSTNKHTHMITGELKSIVDKIWNHFWTGGISNPLTVIEQFTYLLFIRRLDEQETAKEKKVNLIGGEIENPFYTKDQQHLRWQSFLNEDPQPMFDLFTKVQDGKLNIFEHMKQVGEAGGVFAEYMKGATFMIPTPRLLDQVVQDINKIEMVDRDTKGDLYEYLLSKIASAGTNGQFRTPRHIIKMMVEMVQPGKEEIICDPSCGTAGFLVAAGEYFQEHHPDYFNQKKFRTHFQNKMFNGVEFDPTMLRIGAMNLQLHGIETPTLIGKDALSESNGDLREVYTLILANPPFKGSLDYDAVEKSILETVKTKKTELLFLGLMLRMLKTGGRCAVIIPDGVLFGSSKAHKQIRKEIIEHHKLEAVISMPSGVFKPYAGVSTAVVFFTKTNNGGTDKVWFYDMKTDGYSLDDKRNPIETSDIPDIINRFHAVKKETKRKRTDQSFLVPIAEIEENDWDLSINRYKEIVYEEVKYDPPKDIIKAIKDLDKKRGKVLLNLEKMLS